MSTSTLRRSFHEALGGKASCSRARMVNVNGGRQQRLIFDVQPNSGAATTVEDTVPALADLTSKAREMAIAYIATLEA